MEMLMLYSQEVSKKSERLKQLRKAFGMKAKPFAELLSEHVSNYYGLESGDRPIGIHKSNDILNKINTLSDDILKNRKVNKVWWDTGEEEMFISPIDLNSDEVYIRQHGKGNINQANPYSSGINSIAGGPSLSEELAKLIEWKQAGMLTDEEFQAAKRKLLS